MRPWAGIALLVLLGAALPSCRRPVQEGLPATDPDARVVARFLEAYGRRDLEGMMGCLDEEAVFKGTTGTLTKSQIRTYFQGTFRKHPDLRVEAGPLTATQGTIRVQVRVQTEVIWADTWIFELRNHRIRSYALASGTR